MRVVKRVAVAALAVGLLLTPGSVAVAQPGGGDGPARTGGAATPPLPDGWKITPGPDGPRLTWVAPRPVPTGDAAVEFFAGDRRLGRPVPDRDQRTFHLELDGRLREPDLAELRVRAGGRRLDQPAGAAGPRRGQTPPPAAQAPEPLPVNPVDPGTPGPYSTVTGEYELPWVSLPEMAEPVEMRGVVVGPKDAPGKRPLVLFLHGRHTTCYSDEDSDGDGERDSTIDWPCKEGFQEIPGHRGYLRAQELLASQGYLTVSISANGINGQDGWLTDSGAQARSSLVRHHLGRWAQWAGAARPDAPPIVRDAPVADLDQVMLVGHSRGGEGVNRAAMDTLTPPPADQDGYSGEVAWRISGTVLIGPTLFGHNPVPDVPSMTVLPGCDGDVSDLQGQLYVDGTRGVSEGVALHSAVYMVGANHNYFNSEWTPGQAQAPAWDDFFTDEESPDALCDAGRPNRLTPEEQQTAGATYLAAAAHVFIAGDDRVRPLLDGTGVRAGSAGRAHVLSHALGAARTPAVQPDGSLTVAGEGARICAQVASDPQRSCLPVDDHSIWSPHFTPFGYADPEPDREAVALAWSAPGTAAVLRRSQPVSVAGATSLALRMIVPPNTTGTRFDVAVRDAAGLRAKLGEVRLDGLPGTERTASHWAQEVRVPLGPAGSAGLDLAKLSALELVPRNGGGQAWLLDAWGWRPGTPEPETVKLPRVDVGAVTVEEGDSGERTLRIPVRLAGQGDGKVRLFIVDPVTYQATEQVVTVTPQTGLIELPVTVEGNVRYSGDLYHTVAAKAVQGVVVGAYAGGAVVRNDDPAPTVTIAPVADRITEGSALTWRVSLSAEADTPIWVSADARSPAAGPELSSLDVEPVWFEQMSGWPVLPERPLSEVPLFLSVEVPPRRTSADLSVPTVADGAAEPTEYLLLQPTVALDWETAPGGQEPATRPTLLGTVTDGPAAGR